MNRFSAAAFGAALLAGASMILPAYAQETPAAPAGPLKFQLNKIETTPDGLKCQLTFVVQNDTGTVIGKSSYDMAIVNTQGQVSTLITFGFEAFPLGLPRAQQFNYDKSNCEDISAIFINRIATCFGSDGATTIDICAEAIVEQKADGITTVDFPWRL